MSSFYKSSLGFSALTLRPSNPASDVASPGLIPRAGEMDPVAALLRSNGFGAEIVARPGACKQLAELTVHRPQGRVARGRANKDGLHSGEFAGQSSDCLTALLGDAEVRPDKVFRQVRCRKIARVAALNSADGLVVGAEADEDDCGLILRKRLF